MSHETYNFTKYDIECINACRLFLQVNFLSEISANRGTTLLQQAIKGTTDQYEHPILWQISHSNLKWPHQPRPPQKSWHKWKRYLQFRTSPTFQILIPLGETLISSHEQREWRYTLVEQTLLDRTTQPYTTLSPTPSRTRHTTSYIRTDSTPPTWSDSHIPVVKISSILKNQV
jgi:hypothetical protein